MRIRHFLALAAATLLVAFGPPERTTPDRWALVVGISDYMNYGDEVGGDLPGAANDARAMASVLVNKYGFGPDNVKLIIDHDATRDRLVSELSEWLPSVTRPGDMVTIYFAGHGSQSWNVDGTEPDGLDETFCPADVMRGNTELDIRDKEMAVWLAQLNTDNVIVIWDKCHARGSTRDVTPFARPRSLARNVANDVPRPDTQIAAPAQTPVDTARQAGILEIASSQADEVALDVAFPDHNGDGHTFGGAFTTPFVQNLWNAPADASYGEIFEKTIADMKRNRFRQQPVIDQKVLKDRPLFSMGDAPSTPADGPPADAATGMATILATPSDSRVLLSGGADADVTASSIYSADGILLEVVDVEGDRATARVASPITAGDGAAALAEGSTARLVAHRYPEPRLRVMVTELEADVRSALRSELAAVSSLVLIDDRTSFAHLLVRPRSDHFVVLNLDGFARDSVAAGPGATDGLARLLEREYGQYQLAELENPAHPFEVDFAFGNGRSDLVLGETLSFHVTSQRDGYLTIVDLAPDGTVTVIFPNEHVDGNRVHGGQSMQFPAADSDIVFAAIEPAGRGIVRAFVTEQPLVVPFGQGADATEADRIWTALRNAVGEPPVDGSDAIPVESWATSAIVYEIRGQ